MKDFRFNVIVLGVSMLEGMAGTARMQNLIYNFPNRSNHTFSNIIIENPRDRIGFPKSGTHNNLNYVVVSYNLKNPFSMFSFYLNGFKYIKSRNKSADKNILYVYGYPNILNILFILFSKLIKYKTVFDIVEDNRFIKGKRKLMAKIKNASSIFLYNNLDMFSDGCIAISYHLFERAKEKFGRKIPVCLIPISVDPNILKFIPSKSNQENSIFYGGSFGDKDGLPILLEAFAKIRQKNYNIKLILSGKPSNSDKEKFKRYLELGNTAGQVHYLGYLGKMKYYQTLANCDIFCMTRVDTAYSNAGFPFKLGEMLATGKPVIVTNVGDISRYLTHKKNALIIKPGNPEELVASIEYVLQNPEEANRIGKSGREAALTNFDSHLVSNKLEEFFNEI